MSIDHEPLRGLLGRDPVVATSGVALFADELRAQAVPVSEVAWKPVGEHSRDIRKDAGAVLGVNPHIVARDALARPDIGRVTAETDGPLRKGGP